MVSKPYRVHVVVDSQYGARLRDLPSGEAAWVVDSADNHVVVESILRNPSKYDWLTEITTFKFNAEAKPDDRLIGILSAIYWHHGEYAHDPPYSVLNIIGVEWSLKIQQELSAFGFTSHEPTREGFMATRTPDEESPESSAAKFGPSAGY